MDGQYAVSSLDDDEAKRLSGAWVYEGPNIYENLTDAQRKEQNPTKDVFITMLTKKILSPSDTQIRRSWLIHLTRLLIPTWATQSTFMKILLTWEVYTALTRKKQRAIISSHKKINQHMWGGYFFTKDGTLVLQPKSTLRNEKKALKALSSKISHWSNSSHGATSGQKLFVEVEQTCIVISSVNNLVDSMEFDLKRAKASMETDEYDSQEMEGNRGRKGFRLRDRH